MCWTGPEGPVFLRLRLQFCCCGCGFRLLRLRFPAAVAAVVLLLRLRWAQEEVFHFYTQQFFTEISCCQYPVCF
jgi:hypothetical protein